MIDIRKVKDENGDKHIIMTDFRKNEQGQMQRFIVRFYATEEDLPREVLERIFEEEYQERMTPNDIQN